MTSSLKKTSKIVKAWGGFVDGHLDMGWRLFGRDDITPLVSAGSTGGAMTFNGLTDLYPPPGKPSEPPAWEDIERLAQYYPALRVAVALVERGDLTREQALILAVFALADAFQRLFHAEVERRMSEPPKPFIYEPEG